MPCVCSQISDAIFSIRLADLWVTFRDLIVTKSIRSVFENPTITSLSYFDARSSESYFSILGALCALKAAGAWHLGSSNLPPRVLCSVPTRNGCCAPFIHPIALTGARTLEKLYQQAMPRGDRASSCLIGRGRDRDRECGHGSKSITTAEWSLNPCPRRSCRYQHAVGLRRADANMWS